ncbi:MAG: exodeoxyribonuclease III, partial [Kurthia sp.]|nr:exodeoxyribonuclease III [Kurthia sp.]
MKFVSWNVNGIRAVVKKGFMEYFQAVEADFFCIQESKCQEGQIELDLPGYYQYWNYAERKGYSGTAIFTKHKPLSVHYGVGEQTSEEEGRIITLEYEKFYLVNVYTPNTKRDLSRLSGRMEWEVELKNYLQQLDAKKPVIYCGDLNVAHEVIDLKNPKTNVGNAGFTIEERQAMT